MATEYNDESYQSLNGAAQVRERPQVMLGSSGLQGARHGYVEMYGNSIDEGTAGFGDIIISTYHKDKSVSIRDYGRGVPLGWSETHKHWNWHNVYDRLYFGAKMTKYQEDLKKLTDEDWKHFDSKKFPYIFAIGLNGLGATSTQYTSEFMDVKSYRHGICTSRSFRKGLPIVDGKPVNFYGNVHYTVDELKQMPEEKAPTDEKDGTYVHWKPDGDVFEGYSDIGLEFIKECSKAISCTTGMSAKVIDEETGEEFFYPSQTLSDLLKSEAPANLIGEFGYKTFHHTVLQGRPYIENGVKYENPIAVCEIETAIGIGNFKTSQLGVKCFHNCVYMSNGVQYNAVRKAVDDFVKNLVASKDNTIKIRDTDYADLFSCYVSTRANISSTRGQTKDGIDDKYIYDYIYADTFQMLNTEYAKGSEAFDWVITSVIDSAVRRAERIEVETSMKQIQKTTSSKAKLPQKFVSCKRFMDKDPDCELWITEGDSALGAVKHARDKDFQALYPIRGKGLNPIKASIKRVLANKEIQEIFTLLGCGIDLHQNGVVSSTFDISKLRFNKIVFGTDADEDGYQIRVLLFLIFYRLARPLLTEGHVYIAETPRFMITLNDGTRLYAKNDAERDAYKKQYGSKIVGIARFKGLGECPKEVLRETTVYGANRNLIQIKYDDSLEDNHHLIEALFGKDLGKERKAILANLLGVTANMLEDEFADFDTLIEAVSDEEAEANGEAV